MRIGMIGSRGLTSRYSGVESVLRELCPRLVARGHAVTVFGTSRKFEYIDGVKDEPVSSIRTKRLETISSSLTATLRASREKYDLIHFHDVGAGLFSNLAKLAHIPSVVTFHSLDWQRSKWSRAEKSVIRQVEKLAVAGATSITVVSRSLRDYFNNEYGLDSVFIPNVVEPALPSSPGKYLDGLGLAANKYILFAGRLTPEKGVHDLIQAYKVLNTNIALVIAGDNEFDRSYVQDLRRASENSNILFTGHIDLDRLAELYTNTQLFVLPSLVEGRSMALLEAVAHGAGVLASDIAENREVLEGVARFFKAGNVEDLTSKLAQLLNQTDQLDIMRDRSAAFIRSQLSWRQVADEYEKVYRETLRNRR